jgi:hypothetical protein
MQRVIMESISWKSLTSVHYVLLVVFEIHVCAPAITIMDGAQVRYAPQLIMYDYIEKYILHLKLY